MIADDHPLVRSGLRFLLERENEFHVVAEAADGYEAIDLAALHKRMLILLDVRNAPIERRPDAALSISQKRKTARIVMVSMHSTKDMSAALKGWCARLSFKGVP